MKHLLDSVADATELRDREALEQALARLLFEYFDPLRVAVMRLVDEGGQHPVAEVRTVLPPPAGANPAAAGEPARRVRLADAGPWLECVLLGDVVHHLADHGGGEPGTCSVFPLFGERGVVGLVEIEFDPRRGGLLPRDARLICGILRVLRNHLAVLDYGERDMLTGLANRKTFDAAFARLRARRHAVGEAGWLGVADVDRFKSINDRFGHLYGDEVLLLLAGIMRQTYRGADQLFRFGGEEFVVVLDRADPEGAAVAFNRFRSAVEAHEFPQVGRVTVSVGFTRVSEGDLPASAFERADAALYHAKRNGRNRCDAYERLVADGHLKAKDLRADVELF